MLVREYYILFCMQIRQMIKVHFKIQIGKVVFRSFKHCPPLIIPNFFQYIHTKILH